MYLVEHFSRLQPEGREDTVSVYIPQIDEEALSPAALEATACFLRVAANLAKRALVGGRPEQLEEAARLLNRAMEDSQDTK